MYRTTAKKLGKAFDNAHISLWGDAERNFEHSEPLKVEDQIAGWKNKFHAKISGGHFDRLARDKNDWNTIDAVVEFKSKKDFVLFMLEWR